MEFVVVEEQFVEFIPVVELVPVVEVGPVVVPVVPVGFVELLPAVPMPGVD